MMKEKNSLKGFHDINPSILEFQKYFLTNILWFGCEKFEETINRKILPILNCPVVSKDPLLTIDAPFVSLNEEEKIQKYYLVSYVFYLYVEDICTFFIGLQLRSL